MCVCMFLFNLSLENGKQFCRLYLLSWEGTQMINAGLDWKEKKCQRIISLIYQYNPDDKGLKSINPVNPYAAGD